MSHRFCCLTIACAAAFVLAGGGAATARPRPGETTGDDLNTQLRDVPGPDLPPPAPAGFVIVEENLWFQHHDQPAGEFASAHRAVAIHHLNLALQAEARGDASHSGAHREVAAYNVRQQLIWQNDELDAALKASLAEVEKVAGLGQIIDSHPLTSPGE